jgi:hypothetical protein
MRHHSEPLQTHDDLRAGRPPARDGKVTFCLTASFATSPDNCGEGRGEGKYVTFAGDRLYGDAFREKDGSGTMRAGSGGADGYGTGMVACSSG